MKIIAVKVFNLSSWKEETWKWVRIYPVDGEILHLRDKYELTIDQLPVGLIAHDSWLERCTGIAEVMGSIPVQAWIFSGFFFSTA